jgi:hypothetical protein
MIASHCARGVSYATTKAGLLHTNWYVLGWLHANGTS